MINAVTKMQVDERRGKEEIMFLCVINKINGA